MHSASLAHLRWTVPPAFLAAWGGWNSTNERLRADGPVRLWDQKTAFSTSGQLLDRKRKLDGNPPRTNAAEKQAEPENAWASFMKQFGVARESLSSVEWHNIGDSIKNYIVPDWARFLPATIHKLQRELSMAPGSLADDIWRDARDPYANPEIALEAKVRVSDKLCPEELAFRKKRKAHAAKALAKYLDLSEDEIHPDDVPIIAMCGSGGGLRALVAGTGSYLATEEVGLWDCITYTAGVSGSCWLQTLYNSSISGRNFGKLVDHLKSRLGVHIAFPPEALYLLTTAPTNKYLLGGVVEKLKANPDADFGLVDIYGLLLAARLLVPRGELDISERNLKLSNQRDFIQDGSNPLPIYTAVRHEIPLVDEVDLKGHRAAEDLKQAAKQESWFQWFEFTPYEFFCEEFGAGIPMWAVGRPFEGGKSKAVDGYPAPELRVPGLMGIWGSAFCATLAHYYKEIRPVVRGLAGFAGIDSLIEGKNDELVKVHPFDPASIPNFLLGMKDKVPPSCPESALVSKNLQLMDAGMSNNLPIYPLLRPGREIDIIVAFDASADIKQENWLSVVDGYARQRGVKGWPLGAGWPREGTEPKETVEKLEEASHMDVSATTEKLEEAQKNDPHSADRKEAPVDTLMTSDPKSGNKEEPSKRTFENLSFCNVWLGTKHEMTAEREPPPSKRLFHPSHGDHDDPDFHLMQPDAGIAVVYFPLLPNPDAPDFSSPTRGKQQSKNGKPSVSLPAREDADPETPLAPKPSTINPEVDDFLSTWNFVYTPEQIDAVVGLAKANFSQGEAQLKRVVRGVYERRKRERLRRERIAIQKAVDQRMKEIQKIHEGYTPIY